MKKKLSKSISTISLLLSFIAGSSTPSYAYVMNSFDELTDLTPAPNTILEIETVNNFEGTGSLKMSWNADINQTGYFDWALPSIVDMTGETISFMAYAPDDITQIGFELINSSGTTVESWLWNVPPSTYNIWQPYTISQGYVSGADYWYSNSIVNRVDIVSIRLIETTNENGIRYNKWDAVPEPNTLLLVGTGMVFLARLQRKTLSGQI